MTNSSRYEVQTVGAWSHQELWIPAEELDVFNKNIVGESKVIKSFYGERFSGSIDHDSGLPASIAGGQIYRCSHGVVRVWLCPVLHGRANNGIHPTAQGRENFWMLRLVGLGRG